MPDESEQGEFDLGIDEHDQSDQKRRQAELTDAIGKAADERDARNKAKDPPPLPADAPLQDRLDRKLADIAMRDKAVNDGVSPAQRESTSHDLVSHDASAQVAQAGEAAVRRDQEEGAAQRATAMEEDATRRRAIAQQGRAKIAQAWRPPTTVGQRAIDEAVQKGQEVRGETSEEDSNPDE